MPTFPLNEICPECKKKLRKKLRELKKAEWHSMRREFYEELLKKWK